MFTTVAKTLVNLHDNHQIAYALILNGYKAGLAVGTVAFVRHMNKKAEK